MNSLTNSAAIGQTGGGTNAYSLFYHRDSLCTWPVFGDVIMINDTALLILILIITPINVKLIAITLYHAIHNYTAHVTFGSTLLAVTITLETWFILVYFARILNP
jgi:hypothetical protein